MIGGYIHSLANPVDIFAYKHDEKEPEQQPNHQPIVGDAYGSIANAEANLKKTESPVTNPGLTADNSQGFKTRATGPAIDKKDAAAAAASEIVPEGTVSALS